MSGETKLPDYWRGYKDALDDLAVALAAGKDVSAWIVKVREKFRLPASGEGSGAA